MEYVEDVAHIRHPSVRECLRYMKVKKGIEIHHDGDLPARTGIGSSSSFTAGLLHALYALKNIVPTKRQLALDAIHIEQDMLKENVGSQDQVLAVFGGLNLVEFGGLTHFQVHPIMISRQRSESLESHLMLFFTGFSRTASKIAAEQIRQIPRKKKELEMLRSIVDSALGILNSNAEISGFGKLLHESWQIKRSLSKKITTPFIDDIYSTALCSGALGGKLLGAGGGGFILIFAKPAVQNRIREKLKDLLYVPFRFENLGSQIIFYNPS